MAGGRAGPAFSAAPKFQADVTKTPVPRFDLLKLDHYLYIGVQYSRGCPFTCEFCDIVGLSGRVPRTKTTAQMFAELDALYALGYRSHVDFINDDFIGNKKALRGDSSRPGGMAGAGAHGQPFEFSTEASVNLAVGALLDMMKRRQTFFFRLSRHRKSGSRFPHRDAEETEHAAGPGREHSPDLPRRGIFVTAGFIVGFNEPKVAILSRRDGRVHRGLPCHSYLHGRFALCAPQHSAHAAARARGPAGLDASMSRRERAAATSASRASTSTRAGRCAIFFADYRRILERVYDPAAFAGRLQRLAALLDNSGRKQQTRAEHSQSRAGGLEVTRRIVAHMPEPRAIFRRALMQCIASNPASIRSILGQMALYVHVGPFSRDVIARTRDHDRRARDGRRTASADRASKRDVSGRRADSDRRQSRSTAMRDFALHGMLPAKQAARTDRSQHSMSACVLCADAMGRAARISHLWRS